MEKIDELNKDLSILSRKVSRRQAISTGGKVAIGVGAAIVIGGGAYAAYIASTPAPTSSTTSSTSTPTSTTSSASSTTTTTIPTTTSSISSSSTSSGPLQITPPYDSSGAPFTNLSFPSGSNLVTKALAAAGKTPDDAQKSLSNYLWYNIRKYVTPVTKPLAPYVRPKSPPPGLGGKSSIKIGASMSLTGPFAIAGGSFYGALYKWWEQDINSRGGLLGIPVQVEIIDDQSNAANAIANYDKMITQDKVDLLLGPFPTPVNVPVWSAIGKYGMLMFTGGAASTFDVTQCIAKTGSRCFKYIVNTHPIADRAQTLPVFLFLLSLPESQRPKNVGIYAGNYSPFNLGVADGAKELAPWLGFDVVDYEEYTATTTEFTPLMSKFKNLGAEVLIRAATIVQPAILATQAAKNINYQPKLHWDNVTIYYQPWWNSQGYVVPLGEYTTTTYYSWWGWPFRGDSAMQWLDQNVIGWKQMPWLDHPGPLNSLQLIEDAVSAAGTLDQDKLLDFVYSHSFLLSSGHTQFDDYTTHPISATPALAQVQPIGSSPGSPGNMQIIYPQGLTTAKPAYPMPSWSQIG